MAYNGNSIIKSKWAALSGRQASMTSRLYALKPFVVSFSGIAKRTFKNQFANRFISSLNFGYSTTRPPGIKRLPNTQPFVWQVSRDSKVLNVSKTALVLGGEQKHILLRRR